MSQTNGTGSNINLFLILNTTPDGVWVPLVAYDTEAEAEALIGGFNDAKIEAAKQGVLGGKQSAAMFAGRAVALDSSFAITTLSARIVKPEGVSFLIKPASELGGG